jgi:AmmeMemoRadiSam system protein B
MKGSFLINVIMALLLVLLTAEEGSIAFAQDVVKGGIRHSILSGTWYPADPDRLSRVINGFLSNAQKRRLAGELKAVIVPHAGYRYSGQVAAHSYRLIQGKSLKRVVLIGPSHRLAFRGVSVNMQGGYQTPLGVASVDMDFGKKLIDAHPNIQWFPKAHAQEHSLEIQIPFLQTVLDDFSIVPILMGQQDYKTCQELSTTLARIIGHDQETLILASTDLSHFHHDKKARELDNQFIQHVRSFNPKALNTALASRQCEACGGGPTVTVMLAAKALNADRSVILNYANSGDVTGDGSRVVGYLSAAIIDAHSKKDKAP